MPITEEYTVANTAVLTINEFINYYRREIPQLKFVYSQNPDIGQTLVKYIDDRRADKDPEEEMFPLFSFRRSPMRWTELGGPGRRHSIMKTKPQNDQVNIYRTFHGEFDLDFVYLDSNVNRLEEFEILHLSSISQSQENEIIVNLGEELGDFKYYARYNELQDFFLSRDTHHHQGVSGSVTVMGFYFTLVGTSSVIHQINLRIKNFWDEVLSSNIIIEGKYDFLKKQDYQIDTKI